jgi:hypothetical protein
MCRRVALLGKDVSEEHIASIFMVKTITDLKHVSNSYSSTLLLNFGS